MKHMPKVLIVEDEPEMQELLEHNLAAAGFRVLVSGTGSDALVRTRIEVPDLVLLDLNLGDMDGHTVCREIRAEPITRHIPIVILTARAEELDRVLALELGADDYVTKPFSVRELILRLRRLLQRRESEDSHAEVIVFEGLRIDVPGHSVFAEGQRIDLTATEFKLLHRLAQRVGRVFSRDQLLQDVWDYTAEIDSRTVDTHIRRLREKLGAAARFVETVRGIGYRLGSP